MKKNEKMNISYYIEKGDYKKALILINKALIGDTSNEKKLFNKATILYYLQKYKDAEKNFMQLYGKNTNSGILFYSMALVALGLHQKEKALYLLELSYLNGNNESVYKIINLLFTRNGICDYENCKECCCEKIVLNGYNGKPIKDQQTFEKLISNPKQNNAWVKITENKKNEWIFSCKNLGEKNLCKTHNSRPEICRDFPNGILSLKPECSYFFVLSENKYKFRTKQTLDVVLDILTEYKYDNERQIIESYLRN